MARLDRDLSALSLLDPRGRAALVELAESRSLHPADLLNDAVDAFLDLDARHRAEIEAGLKDAEAGDFASADEVAEAFRPR
ncbi:CopG family ribbon-helix-helix protein [Methylobacterium sp. A49B]